MTEYDKWKTDCNDTQHCCECENKTFCNVCKYCEDNVCSDCARGHRRDHEDVLETISEEDDE